MPFLQRGKERESRTACFTHSWAALASAVSQHSPSNVRGDVDGVCHMLVVLSSSSQGWVLCSLASNVQESCMPVKDRTVKEACCHP